MDNDITNEVIESTLENLLDEITDVKKEVSKYHQLAFKHRFSLSFTASFEDAFHSSIYEQTQARPPRIACSACSTLVECETCTKNGTERVRWTRDDPNVAQKEAWQRHFLYVVR